MRTMRFGLVALALLAIALAPAAEAGKACCKKKAAEAEQTTQVAQADKQGCNKSDCGSCPMCKGAGELAEKARGGCAKSMTALIELAEGSGCPKSAAIADKAKDGDVEAQKTLLAMYAGPDKTASTEALAANAKAGCSKSTAKLVAMAKSSGCPKSAAIAEKAESGDAEATAQLIAMYEKEEDAGHE